MVFKYVLAGGPGAGKTKSIEYLQERLPKAGYKVYTIQETASELIKSGLDRKESDFPYYNFSLMLYKELLFEKIAKSKNENAIILCDRGRMDAKAYRGKTVFDEILKRFNFKSEKDVLDSYDGVIFLQSTADGLEKEYVTDEIRIEMPEQVREIQEKLINAWKSHPNFIFVNNSEIFNKKLEAIERIIYQLVNDKANIGITAKELLEYANGLTISDEDMFRIVEQVLYDKKIIARNSCFEH